MLIVVAGLPGSGKSTVASGIGGALRSPVLPLDPIEAAMAEGGIPRTAAMVAAAYLCAERLAETQLTLGLDVVIDAVNHVEESRTLWRALAARQQTPQAVIEVVCSDPAEHQRRITARQQRYPGLAEPTWADVQARAAEYQPWTDPHLVVDSLRPAHETLAAVLRYLGRA